MNCIYKNMSYVYAFKTYIKSIKFMKYDFFFISSGQTFLLVRFLHIFYTLNNRKIFNFKIKNFLRL